jgi:hypothetical protein
MIQTENFSAANPLGNSVQNKSARVTRSVDFVVVVVGNFNLVFVVDN